MASKKTPAKLAAPAGTKKSAVQARGKSEPAREPKPALPGRTTSGKSAAKPTKPGDVAREQAAKPKKSQQKPLHRRPLVPKNPDRGARAADAAEVDRARRPESAGTFGLMDAIRGFDPTRGIKFKTYCTTRIRGSILDELRSQDWVPRLVRLKAHRIEKRAAPAARRVRPRAEPRRTRDGAADHHSELQPRVTRRAKTMFSLSEKWDDRRRRGDGEGRDPRRPKAIRSRSDDPTSAT
jgi:hypothetical protein